MNINKQISRRFLEAINNIKRPSNSEISRQVGKTPQAITEIMKGRNNVSLEVLQYFFKDHYVSSDYVFLAQGDPIRDPENKSLSVGNIHDLKADVLVGEGVVVPVYNIDAYAGDALSFFGNAQYVEKHYRVPFAKEGDISLSVVGNSMYPHIHSGDVIIVRELHNWKEWISYGKCYLIVTKEQLLVKIVRKSSKNGDTHYNIYSVNSVEYDDFEMPKSDITQIFLVIGVIGKRAF